jgi:hypothetical protein
MRLLEVVETWLNSLRAVFEANGVEVVSTRSPPERPNPSLAVNLQRGLVEADLLVWESGHADLSTMSASGLVTQRHFESLLTVEDVSEVLAVLAAILLAPPNK